MTSFASTSIVIALSLVCVARQARADNTPAPYNVVWLTPSEDSWGSMPLGNGDIGLNLWVERDGDVLMYLSKTDAWSENARLLKLARVRITLSPNPFIKGAPFRQALRLEDGTIEIQAGQPERKVALQVWVASDRPVVFIEGEARSPVHVTARVELWRNQRRRLEGLELFSAYGLQGRGGPEVYVEPDTILDHGRDELIWYHRNEGSIWKDNLELQALGDLTEKLTDPLLHRTFGAILTGDPLRRADAHTLETSGKVDDFSIAIHPLTARTDTADEWIARLREQARTTNRIPRGELRKRHEGWWKTFWDRSWILASGTGGARGVTRGYILQRFINACGGRGGSPIKFNGSIFTVDLVHGIGNVPAGMNADYRSWGGPYWWQNTRLPYWSMLASGDFDLMEPLFTMYRDALPLATHRTRVYYGHAGAYYPETMYFWGAWVGTNYGFQRDDKPHGLSDNRYIRYHWQSGIELTMMMLDYHEWTGDEPFLTGTLLPFARRIMTFYDEHYPCDEAGKIRFWPAQALETYWDVPNPMPEIAGLRAVLPRLLALPAKTTGTASRKRWRRMLGELPPLPMRQVDGVSILSPAEKLENKSNLENPELYAVFPYRLLGVGKGDLNLARQTFAHRVHKGTGGWQQDAIQAAMLGLTSVAAKMVTANFTHHHPASRFPAFWGPNFDWVPDQDHGAVAMIALQRMVMQTVGEEIRLLPAWPRDWNVSFRLHAPGRTVIEGDYHGGGWRALRVAPLARARDIAGVKVDEHGVARVDGVAIARARGPLAGTPKPR